VYGNAEVVTLDGPDGTSRSRRVDARVGATGSLNGTYTEGYRDGQESFGARIGRRHSTRGRNVSGAYTREGADTTVERVSGRLSRRGPINFDAERSSEQGPEAFLRGRVGGSGTISGAAGYMERDGGSRIRAESVRRHNGEEATILTVEPDEGEFEYRYPRRSWR
jgi:hypothetical protein